MCFCFYPLAACALAGFCIQVHVGREVLMLRRCLRHRVDTKLSLSCFKISTDPTSGKRISTEASLPRHSISWRLFMEAWQRLQSVQLLHFVHRSCLRQCKKENPLACMLGENPFGLGFPVQGCPPVVNKRCSLQYCCSVTAVHPLCFYLLQAAKFIWYEIPKFYSIFSPYLEASLIASTFCPRLRLY